MSKMRKEGQTRYSYTKFVYSLIEYISTQFPYTFDISSYVSNAECGECKLSRTKFNRLILEKSTFKAENILWIAILLDDESSRNIAEARALLEGFVKRFLDKLEDSEMIRILEEVEANAFIETFSANSYPSLKDFFIVTFNDRNHSAIQCVISSNKLSSKQLIARDENDEVVEYHSKLSKDLMQFKKNL